MLPDKETVDVERLRVLCFFLPLQFSISILGGNSDPGKYDSGLDPNPGC